MSQTDHTLSRYIAFATLGVLTTTQEIAGGILEAIPGADPQSTVEESFSLVAVVSARAAEVGFESNRELGRTASSILAGLPMYHRDYVVGGAVLADSSFSPDLASEQISGRLAFYAAHFPENIFPGSMALSDKMELWMGRVSVPGLPTTPVERLADLGSVDVVHQHLRLLLGFARQLSR